MDHVLAVCAVAALLLVLGAVAGAYSLASSAGAALLAEREARHVAERALDARLLAEQHGHVDALDDELERVRAEASRAARSGAEAAELRAALDRAAGAGHDGALDHGLLRAAREAARARRDRQAAPAAAAAPGGALAAVGGAGGAAPRPGDAPAG